MIKKGDFVRFDFTGYIKDSNEVFDTSIKKVAEDNGLDTTGIKFEPAIICVGEGFIFPKLEANFEGKTAGKYTFELNAEDAFGKKLPNMMKIFNTNFFLKNQIQPMPGLQVNVDGALGVIRAVTGGRTIVDFNHPLAGKDLRYEVEIKEIVTDPKEKLNALLANLTKLDASIFKTSINNGKAVIEIIEKMPDEIEKKITEKITKLIPEIKEVSFIVSEKNKKDLNKDLNKETQSQEKNP